MRRIQGWGGTFLRRNLPLMVPLTHLLLGFQWSPPQETLPYRGPKEVVVLGVVDGFDGGEVTK